MCVDNLHAAVEHVIRHGDRFGFCECAGFGQACSDNLPCCVTGLPCVDGICPTPECADTGEACGGLINCCDPSDTCSDGVCGESCCHAPCNAPEDCCPGYLCIIIDFVDNPGPFCLPDVGIPPEVCSPLP